MPSNATAHWTRGNGLQSAFTEMLTDTVTFTPPSATDKYGKKTYSGTVVTAKAHIMNSTVLTKDGNGEDALITGRMFLDGDYSSRIDLTYLITLPDGTHPVMHRIDNIMDMGANPHHTEIYFGK
jgi:hypothetical protein